jgi:DNA-binding transcriptional LysR family regulator
MPRDLTEHDCINLRLPTSGGVAAWAFRKREQEVRSRVEGRVVLNRLEPMLKAALAGFGLAYLPDDMSGSTLLLAALSRCWPIGAHLDRVTTSTIRAAPADTGLRPAG